MSCLEFEVAVDGVVSLSADGVLSVPTSSFQSQNGSLQSEN